MDQNANEKVPTNTLSIRPLPFLAMLDHCSICDGPAEFGIYRMVEGAEVLTAVVCREHTVSPKEKETDYETDVDL